MRGRILREGKGKFVQLHLFCQMIIKKHFIRVLKFKTRSEYEAVATVAHDRVEWKFVVAKVTGVFCELRGENITKRREARKAKEALQRE